MSLRYSTALSHLILAASAIFCFVHYRRIHGDAFKLLHGTYILIITNSILGVWFWGNPDHGRTVQKPYYLTSALQSICAFPLVTSEILLNSKFDEYVAYMPICASIFPLAFYLTKKSYKDVNDLLITLETIIVGVVSCLQEKYYGIAIATSYAINHFVLRDGGLDVEVPNLDLYNYGLCFFCHFVSKV